jgi:hypothetical protein
LLVGDQRDGRDGADPEDAEPVQQQIVGKALQFLRRVLPDCGLNADER